jgi:predicted  nucleic acid-binding Zn-ribbon protein
MEELQSLADLLDLQDVDLQIDRLLHERQSLPELEAYQSAHARLDDLTKRHEEASARLRELSLDLDKNSGELELGEQKLAAEQNRLYAGGLSARDADYLRQEVEMLGRKNSGMEDRILELMESRDTQEGVVADLAEQRDGVAGEKAQLEETISAAWKSIDAELARREARKADIVSLIPADLLDLYEELRPLKEGVAVGRLAENVCGGCHLRITAAEQLEVKRSDPPRCIHCRRILVP